MSQVQPGPARGELLGLWNSRWRARTDLAWLCRNVLSYDKVDPTVHGPVFNFIQQFPKPTREQARASDLILDNGHFKYIPVGDPYVILTGPRKKLILDSRSWFKCLCAGEKVSLANGTYKTPETLQIGDELKSLDEETFATKTCKVMGIEKQGLQECYEVGFTSGRRLLVSHNHPFLKFKEWTHAESLQPKDRVALVNWADTSKNETYLPYAEIIGWLIGDGSFSNQTVTNGDRTLQIKIIDAAVRAGGTAHVKDYETRTSSVRVQGLRPLCEDLGLANHLSGNKFIPEVLNKTSYREYCGICQSTNCTPSHLITNTIQ